MSSIFFLSHRPTILGSFMRNQSAVRGFWISGEVWEFREYSAAFRHAPCRGVPPPAAGGVRPVPTGTGTDKDTPESGPRQSAGGSVEPSARVAGSLSGTRPGESPTRRGPPGTPPASRAGRRVKLGTVGAGTWFPCAGDIRALSAGTGYRAGRTAESRGSRARPPPAWPRWQDWESYGFSWQS